MATDNEPAPPQSRIGPHSLPIELFGAVFEHLPKPTLLVCTRVSRLWRDCSCPYLFESLTISRGSSYDDFFTFLDQNPEFAGYVRNLTLEPGHENALGLNYAAADRLVVSRTSLVRLMHKLPCLRELRLRYVSFDNPRTHSGVSADVEGFDMRAGPSRLRLFSMESCWAGDLSSYLLFPENLLFEVLSSFRADSIHLSTFSIVFQETQLEDGHGSAPQLHPLNPQCLIINNIATLSSWHSLHNTKQLYDTLHRKIASGCLRKLRACKIYRHEVACLAALGNFLSHSAQDALQSLELLLSIDRPLVWSEETSEHWSILRLNTCRNLKFFSMSFINANVKNSALSPHVPYCAVVIAILPHLPSTLRRLTIKFMRDGYGWPMTDLRLFGLSELDDALEGRFPVLEVFRLEMCADYHPSEPECMAAMSTMMP
ncbi:hypothetical protein GY45DRAFT_1364072, partial [Cubamyces sp. BRFM 1775]